MSGQKAKYDPLEAAKLGTTPPPATSPEFTTPKAEAKFDVTDAPATAPVAAPRPKYRLVEDKLTSIRGLVCSFKAGRIFDSAGYNIEELEAKGLKLELVKE